MTSTSNSADGALLSSVPSAIEVRSGQFVDLLNPDPKTLQLGDIAHALSLTCRYGGHVKRHYSVGEHSLLVASLLEYQQHEPGVVLAGLFHDAAEAYLGDVVAPLKWAMREETAELVRHGRSLAPYDVLSDRMDAAIAHRFEIREPVDSEAVRLADLWALRIEARELTASGGANWRWPGELPEGGDLPSAIDWPRGTFGPGAVRDLWLASVSRWTRLAQEAS